MTTIIERQPSDTQGPIDMLEKDPKEDGQAVVDAADDIPYIDPIEEKRLLRKLDAYIVSILGMLYLISFLDRSTIGNANVAGMSQTLGLKGNEFGTAVSVLYATYTVGEPIYANLLKIVTPKLLMSVSCLSWGVLTLATAWATNYGGLVAIRVLLGAVESGLFPLYLLMTYRREEIARRLSFIYVCAALSGAFGGLLAYGLTQINAGGLEGWQWLYVCLGIITFLMAPMAYFAIPNSAAEGWFLNDRQRELCRIRTQINSRFYDPNEHFRWSEVRRSFMDWKTYIHAINQFLINITLYSATTFLPSIINGMGFGSYYTQLMTVPAYIVAAASFLIFGWLSDRYKIRSVFIVIACGFLIIGYVVLATTHSVGSRYVGVLFLMIGLYPTTALNLAWCSGNAAGHFKRATSSGLMQMVGNCAGAAIGFIFNAQTAPRYYKGLYTAVGATCMVCILVTIEALLIRRENKRRAEAVAAGAEDCKELGDENPHWVYWL